MRFGKNNCIAKTALQEDERRKHLAWLNWLSDLQATTFSDLALGAGVSGNTLTRMRARDGALLDALTVRLLREHWKVEGPETYLLPGFGNCAEEATCFQEANFPRVGPAVNQIVKATHETIALVINTRALELSGILPGHVAIIDQTISPCTGDAVLVERAATARSKTKKMIFRLLDTPFLRSNCANPALHKSIYIDDAIRVIGPIIALFREN